MERSRLVRRPDEGHVGGVCAGLAEHFAVDATLVRLVAIALVFTGPGVPIYIGAWILLPAEKGLGETRGRGPSRSLEPATLAGAALVVVAALIVFDGWFGFESGGLFPLGLIAVGGYLLLRDRPDPTDEADQDPWASSSSPLAAGHPTDPGDPSASAPTATPAAAAPTVSTVPPATSPFQEVRPWWSEEVEAAAPGDPVSPAEPPRPSSALGPIVLGLVAIGAGVLALLHTSGAVDVDLRDALAVALVVLGAGLVVGAWYGRARWLIFTAALLTVVLSGVTALNIPLAGGVGERTFAPTGAADASGGYELAVGELHLDLTDLTPAALDQLDGPIEASLGVGSLQVRVPNGVTVVVVGRASLGVISIDGQTAEGFDVGRRVTLGPGEPDLELDLRVGMGEVEVTRG